MKFPKPVDKIDLHMHTTISDGTDTPSEIISVVRREGISLFSVTDHDAVMGCGMVREILTDDDPLFISGAEFSCRDTKGKYHILAYGYENLSPKITDMMMARHAARLEKVRMRLDALREDFGIIFSKEDIDKLFKNKNPGKPHLANLLIRYGYADTITLAIHKYLDKLKVPGKWFHPADTIAGILNAGGIPVLAHPSYGSGDELIMGDELDARIQRLISFGLQGVEAYYSGFSNKLQAEVLALAEKYKLYVTAGSDYHGRNKLVLPGDTHQPDMDEAPDGLIAFLEDVPLR